MKVFFNPEFGQGHNEKILDKYENLAGWGDDMYEKFQSFDLGGVESAF